MPLRISAQMADDAVAVDTPGEHFGPAAPIVHFELPRLAAHRVLGRHYFHRATRQRLIDGPQHAPGHQPGIETRALVYPERFRLMKGLEVHGVLLAKPI